MTRLIYHSAPRWRETEVVIRDRRVRPLVVAAQPSALMLRLKGTRGTLSIPYSPAYQLAARLEADRIRAEKKAARKKKG